MRVRNVKTTFTCSLFLMFLLVYILVPQISPGTDLNTLNRTVKTKTVIQKLIVSTTDYVGIASKEAGLKYILQWTPLNSTPLMYTYEGQKGFIKENCPFINCYVTTDRNYLGDYTKFDVIAFTGPEVVHMGKESLPSRRSPHQKFVFATAESADNFPFCSDDLNDFFNWTWTYKLDSEAKWGYIVVRDAEKKIIGPKIEMHWMKFEDMNPVSEELKNELKTKTKAAAWFASNCNPRSHRDKFVKELQSKLKKYNLNIDIYGKCGSLRCLRDKVTNEKEECNEKIKKDYYFYLSFENSFSEDYVTEKLVRALQNTAVPIVYGGANYTRFMPDGIYLNARELGVEKLAAKMAELIKNPGEYAEYFRWKKYYSYYRRSESLETCDYCRICSILNEEKLVKKTSIYHNFKDWWNPPHRCT